MESQDQMVSRDFPEKRDPWDPRAHQEPLVFRDREVYLVNADVTEREVPLV